MKVIFLMLRVDGVFYEQEVILNCLNHGFNGIDGFH